MLLILPILLLIIFSIYYLLPPKQINRWYGYRTSYSMQNQETWNYANKVAPKYLLIYALAHLLLDLTLLLLPIEIQIAEKISIFILIAGLIGVIILIERRIRKAR